MTSRRNRVGIAILEPVIAERLHFAGLAADERLRAPSVRGEHAELAHHGPGRYFHAGFAQNKVAGVDEIHGLSHVAFAEQDLAGVDVAMRHERAQPGHVDLAAARAVDLADQISHLLQPVEIERQQDAIEHHGNPYRFERRVSEKQDIRADGEHAQRDHGLHPHLHDGEGDTGIGQYLPQLEVSDCLHFALQAVAGWRIHSCPMR